MIQEEITLNMKSKSVHEFIEMCMENYDFSYKLYHSFSLADTLKLL